MLEQFCPVHTSTKRIAAVIGAAMIGAVLITPAAAQATGDKTPAWSDCANLKNWNPNPDEQDRRPTPTADGLVFKADQLVHHPVTMSTTKLKPGSFQASPTPDQNSFFSVEVRNNDGTGYATLRWNTGTSKWEMSTGGQFYTNADPTALVDMTLPAKSHNVISFGVGYTKNPPGTVETTVRSVSFAGHRYPLTCQPKPEPSTSQSSSHSASPSASASHSASPSASSSSSTAGAVTGLGDNGSSSGGLPVTGAAAGGIAGGAAVLLAAGGVLFVLARRRKVKFTA